MADSERNQEQQPSYTPASFEKRTAAWMGIAYVLMLLFLITFSLGKLCTFLLRSDDE